MSDIYKLASKKSLRFESTQGMLSVEDLWNIPLQVSEAQANRGQTSLDIISKDLNKQLKNSDEGFSLIDKDKKSDSATQLLFDIVKDVIETRLAERDAKAQEKDEAARKQKIRGLIAEKKDQNLRDMPIDELEKLL